jgi:transcriptional regulator with GAF, ATPase, and Fis domain
LIEKIDATRKLALELLGSYGSSILKSYIKPLPKASDFTEQDTPLVEVPLSQDQAILGAIKHLSQLSKTSGNINELLTYSLQSFAHIFGFDRCVFWVLNTTKTALESRNSYNSQGQAISFYHSIALKQSLNIMNYAIQKNNALLVNNYQHAKWQNYINNDIEKLINKGAICIAPVTVGNKNIGVIGAQLLEKSKKINQQNFEQFSFLIEHLNMCLMMMSKR